MPTNADMKAIMSRLQEGNGLKLDEAQSTTLSVKRGAALDVTWQTFNDNLQAAAAADGRSLTFTRTHMYLYALSHSYSHSLTLTCAHTRTPSLTLTHTHTHSYTLAH